MLTREHKEIFKRDGFVVLRQGFSAAEMNILHHQQTASKRLENASDFLDGEGRTSKISLVQDFPADIWGYISRMPRIVRGVEALLGEEVYHWHSKVMVKEAREGGSWEWHQDYGYWYYNDPPFPRMLSAMLAVSDATRNNGCLRVLKGSHQCGRLDHQRIGQQRGAEPDRVEALKTRFEEVYCELQSGDVLFFHCNLLHASALNLSDHARVSYICCYNALGNPPLTQDGHGPCVPITLVEDHFDQWTELAVI